jgi:hypothetical protein
MSSLKLKTIFINPDQAEKACFGQLLPFAQKCWANGADRLTVVVEPEEDTLTAQQRKYYHGVILTEITQQVKPNGQAFPFKVWKEHIRETFLGDEIQTVLNPLTGESKRVKIRISTEDLSVAEYSVLIEKVTAWAVTDLGVMFSCPRWQEYQQ